MTRMVTIASYDLAVQAEFVRNLLEEEGIPAVVTDAQIVAMDWLLSNAVGGVKVQVNESDVERAIATLAKLKEQNGLPDHSELDDEELERQAVEAGRESDDQKSESEPEIAWRGPDSQKPSAHEPEPGTLDSEGIEILDRDKYAWRAFVVSWFSLTVWPLAFYALYLALLAAFGNGPIKPIGRIRLIVVGCLLPVSLFLCLLAIQAWSNYASAP